MFLGVDSDLCGRVFEAKCNQSEQIANFTTVDNIIKAQVGTECGPLVIESLEKEVESGLKKPAPVTTEDGLVTDRMNEI